MLVIVGESAFVPAEHGDDLIPVAPLGGGFEGDAGAEPAGGGEVPERVSADVVQTMRFGEGELARLLPRQFVKVRDVNGWPCRLVNASASGLTAVNMSRCVRNTAASVGAR